MLDIGQPKTKVLIVEDEMTQRRLLQAKLEKQGYEVIEEGLNGRCTVWDTPIEKGRNGLDYLYPCLLSHAPVDLVTIMLGTNDLKRIYGNTASEIACGAARLIDEAKGTLAGPDDTPPRVVLVAPVPVGSVAVTGAGALPCRWVIHAVGPRWGEGDEEAKLRSALRSALEEAERLGAASLAVPAISTGIFGYPRDEGTRHIVDPLRGERGTIALTSADMLRQRWNPFYSYLEERMLDFLALD